eukprot:15364723-Ditylum_brightwellii.AAC.1
MSEKSTATVNQSDQVIGFIGLGKIGYALARNIITKSSTNDKTTTQTAIHYDINEEISTQFAKEVPQSKAASSPEEVASSCDVLFTALPNDAILLSAVFGPSKKEEDSGGIHNALRPSSIHVSCSTVSPTTSRIIASAHAKRSIGFVAAPIFARPDGLALGHATIPLSSSHPPLLAQIQPLLQRTATKVQPFEEKDAGAANVVKLAGNFLIASAIESMSEAFALVEQQGYGQRVATRDHAPYPDAHFALELGKKDVDLVRAAAEEVGVKMPVAEVLGKRFEEALEIKGRGDLDWSAIGLSVSEDAGVGVEKYEEYCRRVDPKLDWTPPT